MPIQATNHVPSNEAAHAMSDALGKFLGRSAEGNFISDRDYLLRELYQIAVADWSKCAAHDAVEAD